MTDQLFIVILNTEGEPDYSNPMEINAKSKNEAYNLVAQDVPAETIAGTFTVPEYRQLLMRMRGGKNGVEQSANSQQNTMKQSLIPSADDADDASGKDFLQNSINEAMKIAKESEQTNFIDVTPIQQDTEKIFVDNSIPSNLSSNIKPNNVQYFMDDGIQFKIDNNILYKKVWETVPTEEYQNDMGQVVKPEFQIINKETGKKINSSKYAVQQLIWKSVQTQPPTNLIP